MEEHVRRLEERLLQPEVRQSAAEVATLLAPAFMEFGSSGRIFTKSQIIEALQGEEPVRRALEEFKTSLLAPGVVLGDVSRGPLWCGWGAPKAFAAQLHLEVHGRPLADGLSSRHGAGRTMMRPYASGFPSLRDVSTYAGAFEHWQRADALKRAAHARRYAIRR